MKTTHKEKLRISRGMKGGFLSQQWEDRKRAIALGIQNKIAKIRKAKNV